MSKKRYLRFRFIPFNSPQPERVYQQIRRSNDPVRKAEELEVLDVKKAKRILRELGKISLVFFAAAHLGFVMTLFNML